MGENGGRGGTKEPVGRRGENIFVSRQMRDYGSSLHVVIARNLLFVKCYLEYYRITRKRMRSLVLIPSILSFQKEYDLSLEDDAQKT